MGTREEPSLVFHEVTRRASRLGRLSVWPPGARQRPFLPFMVSVSEGRKIPVALRFGLVSAASREEKKA
jgi:hypothetical protein